MHYIIHHAHAIRIQFISVCMHFCLLVTICCEGFMCNLIHMLTSNIEWLNNAIIVLCILSWACVYLLIATFGFLSTHTRNLIIFEISICECQLLVILLFRHQYDACWFHFFFCGTMNEKTPISLEKLFHISLNV